MNTKCVLPVLLYAVQVSHDYTLELTLARWGHDVAIPLSAILPASTAAMTVAISKLRYHTKSHHEAPIRIVGSIGALLGISSCLSLYSLDYVDFRTRLVVRSCKPTFVSIALWLGGMCGVVTRAPSWPRAIAVGAGGLLYAVGGRPMGPEKGHVTAVVAIVVALMAEATATLMQSAWLQKRGSSAVRMAGRVNLYKIPFSILVGISLGGGHIHNLRAQLWLSCMLLSFLGAVGQFIIFRCISEFGGELTASLGVGRKAVTYGLSSLTFGSAPIGGTRVAGLAMVLAGMMMPGQRQNIQRYILPRYASRKRGQYSSLPRCEVPV